jgi:hypothetical protein
MKELIDLLLADRLPPVKLVASDKRTASGE